MLLGYKSGRKNCIILRGVILISGGTMLNEPRKPAMGRASRILTASLLVTTVLGALAAQASPVYNGGPVISGTPDVYFIWYGNWGSDTASSILPSFVQTLSGTSYLATETSMAGDGLVKYDGSTSISSSQNSSLYFGGLSSTS